MELGKKDIRKFAPVQTLLKWDFTFYFGSAKTPGTDLPVNLH